jgi:hypothetical protein
MLSTFGALNIDSARTKTNKCEYVAANAELNWSLKFWFQKDPQVQTFSIKYFCNRRAQLVITILASLFTLLAVSELAAVAGTLAVLLQIITNHNTNNNTNILI